MMDGVTTVALLERKTGISRSLFSRYWRDVHGVMAARIAGFDSYTQNHVSLLGNDADAPPFEGIAVVRFREEADRASLIESRITSFIHRDEQNVFRRALLYNLGVGDSRAFADGDAAAEAFLVVEMGVAPEALAERLREGGARLVHLHDLTGGDPSQWNSTRIDDGISSRRFIALLRCGWTDAETMRRHVGRIVADNGPSITAYEVDARYVMVEDGKPTMIGLRGLDAVRTIAEAGADNQLEPEVVEAIYGAWGRRG